MYAVKTTLIVALMLLLSACQSEIDKCTYALMKEGSKEGEARFYCLKAASGNKN